MRHASWGERDQSVTASADETVTGLLETRPFPSFLVDRRGAVLAANAKAHSLLASPDATVRIADGRLRLAACGSASPSMATLIDDLRAGKFSGDRCVSQLDIDGKPWWLVIERVGSSDSTFLASVRRLSDLLPSTSDDIGRHLRLTPSESSLLCALIAADSIVEYASMCDREPSTIRWHMRNLLLKTGCRSQRELVNLALLLTV